MGSLKKFSQFGSAVLPAIAYTLGEELYYIEECWSDRRFPGYILLFEEFYYTLAEGPDVARGKIDFLNLFYCY